MGILTHYRNCTLAAVCENSSGDNKWIITGLYLSSSRSSKLMALSQSVICRNRQRPSRGPSNTRGRLHGIHFYSPEMKANLKKSVVIDFRSSGAKGQQWACPLVMLSPQNHIYITIISSVNTSGLQCVSAPEALHNSSLKPSPASP